MRFFPAVLAVLLLPAGAVGQRLQLTEPATDSTFPLATCGNPMDPPTGRLNIEGVVGYQLAPDGRPDTATVRVLELEYMSVAGFRSATVRRLAGCRMTLPYGYKGAAAPVRQSVEFLDSGFLVETARRLDSMPAGLAMEGVPIDTATGPYALDDSRLEEQPWQLRGCRPQGIPEPPERRFRSREEAARAADEWHERITGEVILQVTVGADGDVVPGSDSLIRGENPLITNALVASIMGCRFHPARIRGVPVAAKTVARMTLIGGRISDF